MHVRHQSLARRQAVRLTLGLIGAACFGTAIAQPATGFASRPITIVVPFAAGGASDITARVIAQEISKTLKTPVVVDNKPGANTQIGTAHVIRAPADGHTLLMGTTSLINNVHFYPQMPYDASRGLAPVAHIVDVPAFLMVGPSVKAKTAKEFITAARAGMKLDYASAGAGSTLHLAAEWFQSAAGFKAQHIPMRGSGPAVTSVAADETHFSFENLGPAKAQIDAGRMRVLAVATHERFALLPNVPTMGELGLPSTDLSSWFVMMAPAATPASVVETLNHAINQALKQKPVHDRLVGLGLVPGGGSPQDLAARMQQDMGKWGSVIRTAKIKLDN